MKREVSVLGLGTMGSTIARLFLKSGWQVRVWNRSHKKMEALVTEGASPASNPSEAVRASPATVVCVSNDEAVRRVADLPGVGEALAARLWIQLTTISPKVAREQDAWARRHGGRPLFGAIQAAPSQMGQADTPILLSGGEADFKEGEPLLKVLAGRRVYLGGEPAAAATMDLATLSYVYGAAVGFFHGALIAQSEALDVAAYGKIVNDISPSFGAFFQHEGAVIQSGRFEASESPLRISVDATARLLSTARETGLSTEFPAFVSSLFARADAAGLANEEIAALVKVLGRQAER
ncbi:MAG TPA: NAD(P)-binding domain-containing protein [Myxococcaceae bacterium]|nr:NAD(P)-binding domain-containing protein [Myxococcaceae bacterium]